MGKAKRSHTRRKRRQMNAALKFGFNAKPKHRLLSGRTGSAHGKKTKPSS